jgi:signal transduction histidine kinase
MEVSTDISLPWGDAADRERAKMRLYVLFQTGGWGLLAVISILTDHSMSDPREAVDWSAVVSSSLIFSGTGLMLAHLSRRPFCLWGWKELGWRRLVPRILVAAAAMATLWIVVGDGIVHGLLGVPLPKGHTTLGVFALNMFPGTFLFSAWLCLYFFYHLFDRLNRSEIERFQLMTSVKEAELRALKSQVNPHFIFNSLNSLRALIDEDPARARRAVTQLANLLRYSLQSGQLETVPFEDELGIVNDYLALEQVRHEERLRLRLDIAPETLRMPIPPMLLQTLVENAVKYGISPREEGGEIAITARNEAGALRIQVSNPGEIAKGGRALSTGVGLHNAAERLRLIFGEHATLMLRSDQPTLVIAEAVIPLPSHP